MRVLITGSAGFVGRHFIQALDTPDHELTTVDVAGRGGMDCRGFFAHDHGPAYDLVLHCAAVVGGRAKIDGAPMAVADNLSIDAAVWQWALRQRPGRVVYFSSSAAYPVRYQGEGSMWRLHEGMIDMGDLQQPDQTYGLAKLVGEVQAQLVRAEGVPVTVLRPFSGYGHDQDPTYPFPAFIQRALRREDPFTIWGSHLQVRDWIHIDDVVGATLAAVDQGVDGPVNLCTGRATTMRELAQEVCRQAGPTNAVVNIAVDESAPLGVMHRVGDPTLMRTFYEPRITLEQGIAMALDAANQEAA